MRRIAILLFITLAVGTAGCGGGSPAAPSAPVSPAAASPQPAPGRAASTTVRLVDVIAGTPMCDIAAEMNNRTINVSDEDGCAEVSADRPGQYVVEFAGKGVLPRTTAVRIPSAETPVSLIPSGFNLRAFDEMFRSADGQLHRWTTAPQLVIVTREVAFSASYANTLDVLSGTITEAERQQLTVDLSDGLRLLTDGRFGAFASIASESPAPGTQVNIMRTGAIVVVRARGLSAATGYWGMGQWGTLGGSQVVAGYLLIDAGFDGPTCSWPQYRRSLRIHELGHALGYGHVTAAQSVMNANARLEPTDWDGQAVHIAFQRLPGSRSPDTDPPASGSALRGGSLTLGPRIH